MTLHFIGPVIVLSMVKLSLILVKGCDWFLLFVSGSEFGESWDPIDWFNPATFLCLSQVRTCFSDVILRGRFGVRWAHLKLEMTVLCFLDIGLS